MLNNALITIFLAATPILEIRGALPVAIGVFETPALLAYWLGVFGNMLPVIPLMLFWRYLVRFLMSRSQTAEIFFNWLFERTRIKIEKKIEKYGFLGLALFVAIPLPVTGAWTATIGAFVFGLPLRRSLFAILLGVMIAGLIVLSLTYGLIFIV